MKQLGAVAIAALMGLMASAGAQDLKTPGLNDDAPRLGDIMSAVQVRHHKLWIAGQARNWELAAFELGQLKAGLVQAAMLYSGIPAGNVTTLEAPLRAVSQAIEDKDARRFAKAIGDVTDGCNTCHRAMKRGFLVMRVPVDQQPFANQSFAPSARP